jgi:glycosyltransferase involved in cell wall biosynthesis
VSQGAPSGADAPLRVLWLIKGLGPGGAEQLLVNHAAVRDREGFAYEAAYLVAAKAHHAATLEDLGVPVTALDAGREADVRWALRLLQLVTEHRIDVVHIHSPYVASVARVALQSLPRSSRPALVYTEHNRWPRHSRATRWANLVTFPLDDAQVAVSHDVRRTITPGLRWPVQVITHGVDVAQLRALAEQRSAVRGELGIEDDELVIGTVANFRAEKAYGVWIEAAAAALRSRPDDGPRLRFVSIGQGPLEATMRAKVAALDVGDRIQLLGYQQDATRLMAAFDIFTLASRHEGLPVSLMDALALGLPVVATRVGGIPEAVTDGQEGHLVPSGDAYALARAYLDLAADPAERRRMGAAARSRGADFDVRLAVDRLEKLYRASARRRPT